MKTPRPLLLALAAALLLTAPGCSKKTDDPAAARAALPELAVAPGGVVAYVDGVSTTFTGAESSLEQDTNESRYYVGGVTSPNLSFVIKFVVPPNQALPIAREQDLFFLTWATGTGVYTPGSGVLTAVRATARPGYSFTGSFSGTVAGHRIEGGRFKDVLSRR